MKRADIMKRSSALSQLCPYIGCIQFMFVFTVKVLSIQQICE